MKTWQPIHRLVLAAALLLIILAGCGRTDINTGPDGGPGNSTVPTIATGIILQQSPTSDSDMNTSGAPVNGTTMPITPTP
jgi:hypothetical protein